MKIALIVSDFNQNKTKYISAGAILHELIEKDNQGHKISVILHKLNKKNTLIKTLKNFIEVKILRYYFKNSNFGLNRFHRTNNVTSKKIFNFFIKKLGIKQAYKYKLYLDNFIRKSPGKVTITKNLNSVEFLNIIKEQKYDIAIFLYCHLFECLL